MSEQTPTDFAIEAIRREERERILSILDTVTVHDGERFMLRAEVRAMLTPEE